VTVSTTRHVAPPSTCSRCGGPYARRLDAELLAIGRTEAPSALCWRMVSTARTCAPDVLGALAWGAALRLEAVRARAAFVEMVGAGGAKPGAVHGLLERVQAERAALREALDAVGARHGVPAGSSPATVMAAVERAALSPRQRLALAAVECLPRADARGVLAGMRRIDHRAAPASIGAAGRALRELARRGFVEVVGVRPRTYTAAQRGTT